MTLRLDAIAEGPSSGDVLVFIQGWPDDATLWDPQVASLSARHRCVRTTMPNFDGRRSVRWGYGTDEIVEALADMVREVSPDAPVTLILHDWGCYWGHLLHHRHPNLVARVVGLDVAPHVEPSFLATLGVIAYQGWLLAAFLVNGRLGDWMTRAFARVAGAPLRREQIHSWMNYPYRNLWRDVRNGRTRAELADYWPEVPLLFVYGKEKPFPFHSRKWIEHLERTGGTAIGLDCGHWVSLDPAFGSLLESWLSENEEALHGNGPA